MLSNSNTKRMFDIHPAKQNGRQGLIVNLKNFKRVVPVPASSIRPKLPTREDILKELEELEVLEQKRETDLFKINQPSIDKNIIETVAVEHRGHNLSIFVIFSLLLSLIIPSFIFFQKIKTARGEILDLTSQAVGHIKQAGEKIANSDFNGSIAEFADAQSSFSEGNRKLNNLGAGVFRFFDELPGVTLLPAAERILRAGEYLSEAAQELTIVASYFVNTDLGIYASGSEDEKSGSLVQAIRSSRDRLENAREKMSKAALELRLINKNSLKSDFKDQLVKIEEALGEVKSRIDKSTKYVDALLSILGNDHPKLYLFIFQNNQEMRATGGFIGTYGLFKIDNGHIEKMTVDGIYNPDGQLTEKIIPPFPLWKVSPDWGLRDSNWFADFPTSAKKIVWFYEKTGGPTVDGVVSFTPTVMERLLKIIGPIEMPEYGEIVTAENFVEVTQREVELEYDKEENRPKQFLTDLTPIVLEKIFNAPKEKLPEIFKVFSQNMKERHIMLYFLNEELEQLALEENLGGALKDTPKDYLSVVNSNIDGKKTDGVIDNEIFHQSQIQDDGSIINTVTIKRIHRGGEAEYGWWNSENKNFVRVYVPKGSEFLGASGFAKEIPAPLLGVDYAGYKTDGDWKQVEDTMRQDDITGTWIFEETGKTVFGNWIYTGPGKTSEVSFKYKLPFKMNREESAGSYSLLVQKQSGTTDDKIFTSLEIPDNFNIQWQYPALRLESNQAKMESVLDTDKFYGVVLGKK